MQPNDLDNIMFVYKEHKNKYMKISVTVYLCCQFDIICQDHHNMVIVH